jgi:TPR repeat protein
MDPENENRTRKQQTINIEITKTQLQRAWDEAAEIAASTRQMAELGDAAAQHALGMMFLNGSNTLTQDNAKAVMWFRMAADQECASSQFNLGLCYAHGDGVPQDFEKATKWWQIAAENGNAQAEERLRMTDTTVIGGWNPFEESEE